MTLVLLPGGIGLSDLFYKHFVRFARDFSVLTFDYQMPFADNSEFADAVAELLMLSEDDATFTAACREDLTVLISDTAVVTDLAGGHLVRARPNASASMRLE